MRINFRKNINLGITSVVDDPIKILLSNIKRTIWQTARRIINEILGVYVIK